MGKIKSIFIAVSIGLMLALGAFPMAAGALPADGTGLTAKVVAISGQTITGDVDASGFDVGIYIGPGVHDVIVKGANVHGANNQGILAQDASNIVIKDSVITNNGIAPFVTGPGPEIKAITLAGTTNTLVRGNIIEDNHAGGIAVIDDGPNRVFTPGFFTTGPTPGATLVAGTGNVITDNLVKNNGLDCGIVVAAKNPRAGLANNVVSKNRVISDPGPNVGGVVVAGGGFGPVTVANSIILNNTIRGGFLPGISIHAFGPGIITGTQLIGNILSNNGAGEVASGTKGIEIFAVPGVGVISGTQVLSDSVSNDDFGVWHIGDTGTHIANLKTSGVTVAVFPP
jgi:hypothetical protein